MLEVARKDRHTRVIRLVEGIVASVFVIVIVLGKVVGRSEDEEGQQTRLINSSAF